ncbi:MAG TPA: sulfate adenylyltransferase [Marmoricola sp.]|nr:sulfate adenylyltransferase [Marmoricola sp.]
MSIPATLGRPARPGGVPRGPQWRLTPRQLCDYELLATGAFLPLRTFLGRADYESVCERMRLADGRLWPMPVTLDLPGEVARAASRAGVLELADRHGTGLARMRIDEAWRPDRLAEAEAVLGTTDRAHPTVRHLQDRTRAWYVSGPLEVRRIPSHPDLPPLVRTPAQVKAELRRRGWTRVVAFNTRNPMHGAHRAVVLRAAQSENACLLIHPVVGPTRPGDVPAAVRTRCYQAVMRTLPPGRAMLSLLPLAMRMAGPREALWHAMVRRNFGATAFIVGRDQASPGVDSHGKPFYGRYAAQTLVRSHENEIGLGAVCLPEMVHVEGLGYLPRHEVPPGRPVHEISGTEVRRLLREGGEIPRWLVPPEVVAELRQG